MCGAIYDSDNHVVHTLSSDAIHIAKMRGAKYSQSYSEHTFFDIREMLENNRWVLFSGTPCQVAALKSYLGKNYERLILVDIVCHGVPSPLIWNKYLDELINNTDVKLKNINLRSKVSGWSRYKYSTEFIYEDGKQVLIPQNENHFMRGFVSNLYLRPSCSNCSFKGVDRVSDFTLGDYWGIWNQYAEFDDNIGTSMVIIHGIKGRMLWNNIKNQFDIIEVSQDQAIHENPSIVVASKPHEKYELFWQLIDQDNPVIEAVDKCLVQPVPKSFVKRSLQWIKRHL